MRYFDGEMWTDHYHHPGRLPDIGAWLNATFGVFGRYWRGASALAFGTSLVGALVTWLAIRGLLDDVAIVDEQIVGAGAGTVFGLFVLVLVVVLWQGFGWLAMSRYMHKAHFQDHATVTDALVHASRRLPRYMGVILALALVVLAAMLATALLTAISPVLGILAIIGLAVGAVWAFVKLAFLFVAIAAAPPQTSVLRASASVSENRFWGVFGRLLLVFVGLAIAGQIIAVGLGEYGQMVDAEQLSNLVQVDGEVVTVSNVRFVDLLPSPGLFIIVLVVNSAVQAATGLVTTSALMRLYLDAGAPASLD